MSVVLIGDANKEGSPLVYSGQWFFAKEKQNDQLKFSYKKVSDTVPRDLLDFVSFIPAIRTGNPFNFSSASSSAKKKRGKSNKLKHRHFGGAAAAASAAHAAATAAATPFSASPPAPSTSSETLPLPHSTSGSNNENEGCTTGSADEGDSDNRVAPMLNESNDVEDARSVDTVEPDEESAMVANIHGSTVSAVTSDAREVEGAGAEGDDTEGDDAEPETEAEADADTYGETGEDSAANTARPTHPVMLKSDHPLFGLWEGSFDVVTVTPCTESTINETFFFHSFIGVDPGPELACLPQEAHFTMSVLKAVPFPLLPGQLTAGYGSMPVVGGQDFPGDQIPDASSATDRLIGGSVTANLPDTPPKVVGNNSSGSSDQVQNPAESLDTETSLVRSCSQQQPPRDKLIVLVGFGRNKFGRFSLTASYNAEKGLLVCEKRYMLTKSASVVRKGKLHRGGDGGEQGIDRSMLARPRSGSYLDFEGYEPTSGLKRKRAPKAPRGFSGDDDQGSGGEGGNSSSGGGDRGYGSPRSGVSTLLNEGDDDDYKSAFFDETTGEVFEGGWHSGKRHGRGICLFIDGSMFEGNWSLGKESGHGQLLSGDRQVIYMGEWQDGLMHGHGTYNFSNGDKYTGEWREGNRHGKGELFINGGCKYVGEWKDNKRSGRGVYTWPDGSYYDGEWENDNRHGKGVLILETNKFFYDGLWVANHPDGRGVCTFASGMEYQGSFKAGLREGRGSIKFPGGGAVYEGRFRDDRIDGQGTLKILETVAGGEEGEQFIPIDIQADLKRIHLKAGFGYDEPKH